MVFQFSLQPLSLIQLHTLLFPPLLTWRLMVSAARFWELTLSVWFEGGGFGSFGGNQGAGFSVFGASGPGRPPADLLTQMRK